MKVPVGSLRKLVGRMLTHLCDVERKVTTSDNAGSTSDSWEEHLTDQECLSYDTGQFAHGQEGMAAARLVATHVHQLILPRSVDVGVRDRVLNVREEDGTVLYAGPLEVTSIGRYPSHIELAVTEIT